MTFNPKVSIIIPVYNGSNYMREAIDSALAQTYQNKEVIVVNDGSDDSGKTDMIAKSYGDKIRYFYKKNGGVSTALNFGIEKMEGEYFSWLSHDDIFYPEKTAKQIEFLKNHPGAKVVFCNPEIIDATGKTTSKLGYQEGPEKLRGAIHFWDLFIYACSLLIHRSCIESIGRISEGGRTTGDIELILMLLHRYNVWHLKEILVKRRDHHESGYYKQNNLVLKETEDLLFRMLDTYGISFFYKKDSDSQNIRSRAADTYQTMGDIFFGKLQNFSSFCYHKSFTLNPSLLNFSRLKYAILATNSIKLLNTYCRLRDLSAVIKSHCFAVFLIPKKR